MKLERKNIQFPLWRKKVDKTLLVEGMSPIPSAWVNTWDLDNRFSTSVGFKSKEGQIEIIFKSKSYNGVIVRTKRGQYRFKFLDKKLIDLLKETFNSSYIRVIEGELRKSKNLDCNIENEIPFWEFIDIEFNVNDKQMILTAHYVQKSIYNQLFMELSKSHAIEEIENRIFHDSDFKIVKSDWKEKNNLKSQIDFKNVIYNLIDTENKEIYIGEAHSLKDRVFENRSEIPNWNHYRFDSLPEGLTQKQRVAIERLIIRTFASFFKNTKSIDSFEVSDFVLKNKKIDL